MRTPVDVADMVEEELLAERERVKDVPTVPPKTVLERVAGVEVQEADVIAPPAKPVRKARLVEQVAVAHDPRREESEPPAPPDPNAMPTQPPPPGYDGTQTG